MAYPLQAYVPGGKMKSGKLMLLTACIVWSGTSLAQGQQPQPAIDDGQIANIMQTVDSAEMEAAKYAQLHATNSEVKAFARQMSVDHRESEKKESAALKASGISPVANQTSTALHTEAQQKLKQLTTLKGKDFDKAYVEAQLDMHRKALDTIDSQLLPNAKSDALKTYIKNVRPKIEAHLRQAETLNDKL